VSRPLRGCGGAFRHMRPHHYRVLVLLLLSDIARHLPGALRNANINFILPALHLRPSDWFHIVGVFPTLIPAAMDLAISGELIDTTHRPMLLAIALGIGSSLQLILGGGFSVGALVAVASFSSAANALVMPTCLSLIFSHLPHAASSFASSVVFSSMPFAGLLCDLIVTICGAGFTTGFLLIGGLGLLISAAVFAFLDETPRPHSMALRDVGPNLGRQYALFFRTLLRAPIFLLIFALFFLEGCMGAAHLNTQLWLVRERGFDPVGAARFTMLNALPAIAGYWIVGYLSDELAPRVHRLVFASVLHVIGSFCMLFMLGLPRSWPASFCGMSLLTNMCISQAVGPAVAAFGQMVPESIRGSSIAISTAAASTGIFAFSQLFGAWIDDWHAKGIEEPIAQCQRIAAVVHLMCVPILLVWWRRYDRDAETLAQVVPIKPQMHDVATATTMPVKV